MIRVSKSIAFILMAGMLASCARIPYKSEHSPKPVTSAEKPAGYQIVQHIHEKEYQFFLFWGIFSIDADGQEKAFRPYLDSGDAIVNVRSRQQWDVISWLASSFTYGIVHLVKTEFEGDLVRKA